MIENNKTIITLEEGEEVVIEGITLKAGDSFEILEAKKDGTGSDSDKKASEKGVEKKDGTGPHGKGNGPGKGKADGSGKADEEEMNAKVKTPKKKESVIYTIEDEVKIGDIILEKGDRFEVLENEESNIEDKKKDKKSDLKNEKNEKKDKIYTVKKEITLPETDIILEKGDKFKILKEGIVGYSAADVNGSDSNPDVVKIYATSDDGNNIFYVKVDEYDRRVDEGWSTYNDFNNLDFEPVTQFHIPNDILLELVAK